MSLWVNWSNDFTFSICRCEWTGAMISLLFQVQKYILTIAVNLKLKVTSWSTWPLLSVLVFVLPRWFFCCFVRIFDPEIHSSYHRFRGLHAWPWNWMSRHGLRDTCHICLYLCYHDDLFCFVRFLGQRIHSNYCHSRDSYVWPWNSVSRHGLTFVISGHLYVSYHWHHVLWCQPIHRCDSGQSHPTAWLTRSSWAPTISWHPLWKVDYILVHV